MQTLSSTRALEKPSNCCTFWGRGRGWRRGGEMYKEKEKEMYERTCVHMMWDGKERGDYGMVGKERGKLGRKGLGGNSN